MTTQLPIPYDELPLWMRQARQEFDWSILIALAMSIAIAWSFLLHDELPAGHQLEHTVFQASDIVTGFQEGRFYPRWSPYAINGYGAPIPNYYPMGTPYIIATIETLFSNNLNQAVRIIFILTYVVAGLGTYLLVSRRTDAPIGLLTSVLYLYSPMMGSMVPYVMGDLALLMGGALLPLSLWSSYRLVKNRFSIYFVMHSVIIALFVWIHPQLAVISIIMSYGYALIDNPAQTWIQRISRLTLAIISGWLLVSFYWLPAILEHNLVNWYQLNSYSFPMLTPHQLIEPMQQIDSGLVMPQPQFKLGWVIITLTVVGFVTLIFAKSIPRRFYLMTGMAGVFLLAIALVIAPTEVWLLVPITLCFSILGGSAVDLRKYFSIELGRLLLVLMIAVTLIFSISVWLVPSPNITLSNTDALTQLRFEQQGYGISTLSDGKPLPSTIDPSQPANRFLINSYELNAPQRYSEQQNNAKTIVSLLDTSSHQQTYRIFNAESRELTFIIPYFAGWQAYLSDVAIPTYANPDNGLLTARVPKADNEEMTIILTGTPVRNAAWLVSVGMVTILILIILFNPNSSNTNDTTYELIVTMQSSDVRLTLFMFLCLGVIISIFTSEIPPIQLQNPPTFTLSQSLPVQSRTSAGLEATTFDLSKRVLHYGEELDVTIYWQALTPIQANYKSRVLLRDINNRVVWYTGELQYPSPISSKRWTRNLYVADIHRIQIPDNLILGDYQVLVELYPCDSSTCNLDAPAIFFDINGNLVGKQLEIPLTITIQ